MAKPQATAAVEFYGARVTSDNVAVARPIAIPLSSSPGSDGSQENLQKMCPACSVPRFELKISPCLGNDGGNLEKVPMPLPFLSLLSWSLHPVAGSFRSQFPTASLREKARREREEETSSSIIHNSHSSSCCPLHTRERDRASEWASSS